MVFGTTSVFLFFTGGVDAQPSRKQMLADAYKESKGLNGNHPSHADPSHADSMYGVNMPTRQEMIPPGPPQGGFLKDPLARADDLIYVEPRESRMTVSNMPFDAMGNGTGNDAELPPPLGNPRDPLTVGFMNGQRERQPLAGTIDPYEEMKFDARLNDVCFINNNCGWAVGDHGTIWFSGNGSQWVLQNCPIDAPLNGVHFVDENRGIIVGGYTVPYSRQGRGVVLVTADGGRNWQWTRDPQLPILYQVVMNDAENGWAAGCSSESCPSGLFTTSNGGRTWTPVPGKKTEGWRCVDFYDPANQKGIGLGFDGIVQTIDTNVLPMSLPAVGIRRPRAVRMYPQLKTKTGFPCWMVGEGGLILCSSDSGRNWVPPAKPLPENSENLFDLNTLCVSGNRLWVAGSPGTKIFSTKNGGRTWDVCSTGVSLPIRKMVFTDTEHGWAVGDLGMILATENGGKTWLVRRIGGRRLSVLALYADIDKVPFETLAKLCGDEGYLGGLGIPVRPDSVNPVAENGIPRGQRLHEAVNRCGGSATIELWAFSSDENELLTSREQILKRFDKDHDGKGAEKFRAALVQMIRQWKPEIIIAAEGGGFNTDPLDTLIQTELTAAVEDAADATRFPEQVTVAELEPWTVKKVHLSLPKGVSGDLSVRPWNLASRLGLPFNELADTARGLLRSDRYPVPQTLEFATPLDRGAKTQHHDFLAGLNIMPGSEARRGLVGVFLDQQEEAHRRMTQRRNILNILEKMAAAQANGKVAGQGAAATRSTTRSTMPNLRLAAAAGEMARKLDKDGAVNVLLDMGRRYAQHGDWESAAEVYTQVVTEHQRHPLAGEAFLWLIRYYASEETAMRSFFVEGISGAAHGSHGPEYSSPGGPTPSRTLSKPTMEDQMREVSRQARAFESQGGQQGEISSEELIRQRIPAHLTGRTDQAVMFGKIFERLYPEQFNDPQIRFAVAAAQRLRGWSGNPEQYFLSRARAPNDDVWSMRARAEYWLGGFDKTLLPKEQQECPIPAVICTRTARMPFLEGKFDGEEDRDLWYGSKLYTLTPATPRQRLNELLPGPGDPKTPKPSGQLREDKNVARSRPIGTQVMFLHDDQYLYFGLRCRKTKEFVYEPIADTPRSRDSDLAKHDRVEILIDVDRDYGTYYNLTVDYRGWVNDSCWGDENWNPNWFVARTEEEDHWLIEAAIPLESLTAKQVDVDTAWGLGLRRIVPGVGIECWNAENSFDLEEAFGLMLFQR